MQYSGGIHTDKVEGNGSCKVDEDGCGSGASVDANPLIGGKIAGRAQCHILKTRDINCGTVRPVEKGKKGMRNSIDFKPKRNNHLGFV